MESVRDTWTEKVLKAWGDPPRMDPEEILAYACGLVDGERSWSEYVAELPSLEASIGDEMLLYFGTPSVRGWTIGRIMYTSARFLDRTLSDFDELGDLRDFCRYTCYVTELPDHGRTEIAFSDRSRESYWHRDMPLNYAFSQGLEHGISTVTADQRLLIRSILLEVALRDGEDLGQLATKSLNCLWDRLGSNANDPV